MTKKALKILKAKAGALGGAVKSKAKAAASRENGAKGGRPRKAKVAKRRAGVFGGSRGGSMDDY